MHPIIQAEVDEFEKDLKNTLLLFTDRAQAETTANWYARFFRAALHRAVEKAGKEVAEIKGCRYGCFCATCSLCDENTFIHCGNCVTGFPISLKSAVLSKLDTIINFKE